MEHNKFINSFFLEVDSQSSWELWKHNKL